MNKSKVIKMAGVLVVMGTVALGAAEIATLLPSSPLSNYTITEGSSTSIPAQTSGGSGGEAGVVIPLSSSTTDAERIVIKNVGAAPVFAMKNAGTVVSLRGVNWDKWDGRPMLDGSPEWWYRTFDVSAYDPVQVDQIFAQFQLSKYHYVRVFVSGQDPDAGFGLNKPGIDPRYVANVGDFLRRARAHNLSVVLTGQYLTGQWLPKNYLSLTTPDSRVENSNQLVLNPSYARALGQFYQDLLRGLKQLPDDPSSAILGIDIYNEISVNRRERPFSIGSGSFAFGGTSYDLGSGARRQALIDAATVSWLNTVVAAIRQVDGQVLTTASVFTVAAVGAAGFNGAAISDGDSSGRAPLNPAAIAASNVDFVDIHIYSVASNYSIDQDLATEGGSGLRGLGKPLVMGEVGAFKSSVSSAGGARTIISTILARSCAYGFAGWAYWNWDQVGSRPTDVWALIEDNGSVNAAVAPSAVPDVCGASSVVSRFSSDSPLTGFFKVGQTIYYANGQATYCAIASWPYYLAMGGQADQSNVATPGKIPAAMRDDGVCAPPAVNNLAVGRYKLSDGKSGIFYSNGSHYCVYRDWAAYLNAGGTADQSGVTVINALPVTMPNDGYCQ